MAKIESFRAVVELWGTRENMAADLDANSRTVSKWWQRGRIPPEWWSSILASPVAKAAGLNAETMAALAAREPGEVRE